MITLFERHDEVRCVNCRTRLTDEPYPVDVARGTGSHCKRCPKCHLVTTYDIDMSPAEAAAIELEEPDWRERFEEHAQRFPNLPAYLAWDQAFEAVLKDWRRFHGALVEVNGEPKNRPAAATEGMIALAGLRIFPARMQTHDLPTGDPYQEQHDAHVWLIMSQRAWRITAVEDRMLILDSFGEQTQVDLSRAKWGQYIEKATQALDAMRQKNPSGEMPQTPEGF